MTPEPVAYVRDLMRGFPAPWLLCGGWAVDAWLGGRTRDHYDVDLAVLHDDQRAVFTHFAGWTLVAHDPNVADDTDERWAGRPLDPPAHIHVPNAANPLAARATGTLAEHEFEFLLNERAGADLVLNKGITVPLADAARESPWGVPTLAPEVVLFYKGRGNHPVISPRPLRPNDQRDFEKLRPTLPADRKEWLRETLARVDPDHVWLRALA